MDKLIEQHLPQVKQLLRQYGVEKAYLFGSAARGSTTENSDVDLIIRFPHNMHYTTYAENYFALAEALETLLHKKVELVTEKTLKNPYLLQNINGYKLPLLCQLKKKSC
jgi:predicted nucleotidyltransferase